MTTLRDDIAKTNIFREVPKYITNPWHKRVLSLLFGKKAHLKSEDGEIWGSGYRGVFYVYWVKVYKENK